MRALLIQSHPYAYKTLTLTYIRIHNSTSPHFLSTSELTLGQRNGWFRFCKLIWPESNGQFTLKISAIISQKIPKWIVTFGVPHRCSTEYAGGENSKNSLIKSLKKLPRLKGTSYYIRSALSEDGLNEISQSEYVN